MALQTAEHRINPSRRSSYSDRSWSIFSSPAGIRRAALRRSADGGGRGATDGARP